MTIQSQQQQMAQPDEVRSQGTAGAAGSQQGATATMQEEHAFWGGACGAGAGAAILWQPITVQGSRRR
ncbi:hypothetical protein [Azospirillum lipoferum]|uniref:Uncharacterized protein n=1 Tax=Azospirillum lipoferum (strain 4B) TaxID=862719 RepID=G7ZHS7_AZOL4|nr:hypothetical protein [Azospirillum lipoferum]CBS91105.1 protein of unknown function [Azospirillum lipoferum 4B]